MSDDKATWDRFRPPTPLTREQVTRLLAPCFPGRSAVHFELLPGGLSNTNVLVRLEGLDCPVVLRLYNRDPAACRKEAELHRLVGAEVPVPEILHTEPGGADGLPPYSVLQYVEGLSFRQVKDTKDPAVVGPASLAVGRCLARIGLYRFPRPGLLGAGLEAGGWYVEGSPSIPRLIDLCLAAEPLQRRVEARLVERIHAFAWARSERLSSLDAACSLVHADFNSPNLLMRPTDGRWEVAAVLDWEFAFSGSPLWDVGNFLRYERRDRLLREPWFSRGCLEGGMDLPEDWRGLARAADLTSLCEILSRDPLPPEIAAEVVELLKATVEDRDPVLR